MMNTTTRKKNYLPFQPALLLMALWLGLPLSVRAADIAVTVDRNPVAVDESFQINFTATESPDDEPDFTPLQQDFSVLGQSQAESSSWINGKASKTIKWIVSVMAKKPGDLVIPPIKFGDDASPPLPIKVTSVASNNKPGNDADLFMEVTATPKNPYLQAQVLYTMKLYTRIEIDQASLNEPELADAVIEKLTEDSNYNTKINGVEYSVIERKYAVFPQKSGTLTIKPLVLTAEVSANGRSTFNSFFNPQLTRNKRVESNAVTLSVKPLPAAFTGTHWLPAEQLEISQQWSGDLLQMKVGEPLTRTLTLRAKGASVGQLPELNVAKTDPALKIYPDQPVLQEQKTADGLIAIREEKLALMPSKAGAYTLPAIEVPWFNTKTEKMEIAKIPETTIHVLAAAAPPAPVSDTVPVKPASANPATTATPVADSALSAWFWVSIFLAIGWLLTVVYFLARNPAKPSTDHHNGNENNPVKLKQTIAELKQACAENDAVAAKNALLEWGQQLFAAGSLGAIAVHCEARLRDEILYLNQVLYGKEASAWQGKKLFQAFSENQARKKMAQDETSALKPLYPL